MICLKSMQKMCYFRKIVFRIVSLWTSNSSRHNAPWHKNTVYFFKFNTKFYCCIFNLAIWISQRFYRFRFQNNFPKFPKYEEHSQFNKSRISKKCEIFLFWCGFQCLFILKKFRKGSIHNSFFLHLVSVIAENYKTLKMLNKCYVHMFYILSKLFFRLYFNPQYFQ